METNRQWMYGPRFTNGKQNREFREGVDSFIEFATSQPTWMDGEKIRCPCTKSKCQNKAFLYPDQVREHLMRNGFRKYYDVWVFHGENIDVMGNTIQSDVGSPVYVDEDEKPQDSYHAMIIDAAGPNFNVDGAEESPNPEAKQFFEMLDAADQDLWPGCQTHSQLSYLARLMTIKAENKMTIKAYDEVSELMKEVAPTNNLIAESFRESKKRMRAMGLPVEKIDCCVNGCMLYWRRDKELINCKFCDAPRFKTTNRKGKDVARKKMYYFPLVPRLQRLYASNATAAHMKWHANSSDDGFMRHPSDSMAWKHFNNIFPDFAAETRNVRLGLCTDGFQPFGMSGQQYSSWPVIVTTYNLLIINHEL